MRSSEGRIEKRASAKVPVRLVPMEIDFIAETTATLNISRRGARVLTSQRWDPGDQLSLSSMSGEFRRQGRVIYCYPLTNGQFCVGLEFCAGIKGIKDWKEDAPADVAFP
jgi:PilZ domain